MPLHKLNGDQIKDSKTKRTSFTFMLRGRTGWHTSVQFRQTSFHWLPTLASMAVSSGALSYIGVVGQASQETTNYSLGAVHYSKKAVHYSIGAVHYCQHQKKRNSLIKYPKKVPGKSLHSNPKGSTPLKSPTKFHTAFCTACTVGH